MPHPSDVLKSRLQKIGAPPGSLDLQDESGSIPEIHISLMDFNSKILFEKQKITPEECAEYVKKPTVSWINITGIRNAAVIEELGKLFNLHPLLMEDILNPEERSKIEQYENTIFVVMRMLKFNEETQKLGDQQVSLIIGKDYVLSFFEEDSSSIIPIQERIRHGNNRIRNSGADYLAYAIIDTIVDNYFIILAKIDAKLEKLEVELVNHPDSETLHRIQRTKREMTILRRSVWPVREVISHFRRIESPLIKPETVVFMHDVYDHTIQAIDTIEGFREIVAGMLEIYLSTISHRLNEIMKVLTIVATIFAPLTFITGFYGMNFKFLPGLQSTIALVSVVVLMTLSIVGMLLFFRHKKWI